MISADCLDQFWRLGNHSPETRSEAAQTILNYLQQCLQVTIQNTSSTSKTQYPSFSSNNSAELDYCINRLVRGLTSPRECVRQGFTTTLSLIITNFNEILNFKHIWNEINLTTDIKKNITSGEKNCLFGRLFGYISLQAGGYFKRNEAYLQRGDIFTNLWKLYDSKDYLRSPTSSLIYNITLDMSSNIHGCSLPLITPRLTPLFSTQFVEKISELNGKSSQTQAPFHFELMGLFLLLKKYQKDNGDHIFQSLNKNEYNFYQIDIFSPSYLPLILKHLWDTSYAHPRFPEIWDTFFDLLFHLEDEQLIQTFEFIWREIDKELFGTYHTQRQFLGFRVVIQILFTLKKIKQELYEHYKVAQNNTSPDILPIKQACITPKEAHINLETYKIISQLIVSGSNFITTLIKCISGNKHHPLHEVATFCFMFFCSSLEGKNIQLPKPYSTNIINTLLPNNESDILMPLWDSNDPQISFSTLWNFFQASNLKPLDHNNQLKLTKAFFSNPPTQESLTAFHRWFFKFLSDSNPQDFHTRILWAYEHYFQFILLVCEHFSPMSIFPLSLQRLLTTFLITSTSSLIYNPYQSSEQYSPSTIPSLSSSINSFSTKSPNFTEDHISPQITPKEVLDNEEETDIFSVTQIEDELGGNLICLLSQHGVLSGEISNRFITFMKRLNIFNSAKLLRIITMSSGLIRLCFYSTPFALSSRFLQQNIYLDKQITTNLPLCVHSITLLTDYLYVSLSDWNSLMRSNYTCFNSNSPPIHKLLSSPLALYTQNNSENSTATLSHSDSASLFLNLNISQPQLTKFINFSNLCRSISTLAHTLFLASTKSTSSGMIEGEFMQDLENIEKLKLIEIHHQPLYTLLLSITSLISNGLLQLVYCSIFSSSSLKSKHKRAVPKCLRKGIEHCEEHLPILKHAMEDDNCTYGNYWNAFRTAMSNVAMTLPDMMLERGDNPVIGLLHSVAEGMWKCICPFIDDNTIISLTSLVDTTNKLDDLNNLNDASSEHNLKNDEPSNTSEEENDKDNYSDDDDDEEDDETDEDDALFHLTNDTPVSLLVPDSDSESNNTDKEAIDITTENKRNHDLENNPIVNHSENESVSQDDVDLEESVKDVTITLKDHEVINTLLNDEDIGNSNYLSLLQDAKDSKKKEKKLKKAKIVAETHAQLRKLELLQTFSQVSWWRSSNFPLLVTLFKHYLKTTHQINNPRKKSSKSQHVFSSDSSHQHIQRRIQNFIIYLTTHTPRLLPLPSSISNLDDLKCSFSNLNLKPTLQTNFENTYFSEPKYPLFVDVANPTTSPQAITEQCSMLENLTFEIFKEIVTSRSLYDQRGNDSSATQRLIQDLFTFIYKLEMLIKRGNVSGIHNGESITTQLINAAVHHWTCHSHSPFSNKLFRGISNTRPDLLRFINFFGYAKRSTSPFVRRECIAIGLTVLKHPSFIYPTSIYTSISSPSPLLANNQSSSLTSPPPTNSPTSQFTHLLLSCTLKKDFSDVSLSHKDGNKIPKDTSTNSNTYSSYAKQHSFLQPMLFPTVEYFIQCLKILCEVSNREAVSILSQSDSKETNLDTDVREDLTNIKSNSKQENNRESTKLLSRSTKQASQLNREILIAIKDILESSINRIKKRSISDGRRAPSTPKSGITPKLTSHDQAHLALHTIDSSEQTSQKRTPSNNLVDETNPSYEHSDITETNRKASLTCKSRRQELQEREEQLREKSLFYLAPTQHTNFTHALHVDTEMFVNSVRLMQPQLALAFQTMLNQDLRIKGKLRSMVHVCEKKILFLSQGHYKETYNAPPSNFTNNEGNLPSSNSSTEAVQQNSKRTSKQITKFSQDKKKIKKAHKKASDKK